MTLKNKVCVEGWYVTTINMLSWLDSSSGSHVNCMLGKIGC